MAHNLVIWCSISIFFSGIKNLASFLVLKKIWNKTKKLCRFKISHQIEDPKERILVVPQSKNQYFLLELDIESVLAWKFPNKPKLDRSRISNWLKYIFMIELVKNQLFICKTYFDLPIFVLFLAHVAIQLLARECIALVRPENAFLLIKWLMRNVGQTLGFTKI